MKSKIILSVLGLSLVLGTFEAWADTDELEKKFERSSEKNTDTESSGCSSCS